MLSRKRTWHDLGRHGACPGHRCRGLVAASRAAPPPPDYTGECPVAGLAGAQTSPACYGHSSVISRQGFRRMRSLPTGEPKGTFHAVSTRDGVALLRNGQPFYEINVMGVDSLGAELFEILFGDGVWMLASSEDIAVG